jgi:hypothetical protein
MYSALRSWILGRRTGAAAMSAERMFDRLYRMARELEQSPEQARRQIAD